MFKVFQSGEFLCSLRNNLGTLGKDMANGAIPDPAIPLAKDVLQGLVSNMVSNAILNVIDKLGRNITGNGAVRAGRGFTFK